MGCREFVDLAICPDDRLKLELLILALCRIESWASAVAHAVLRKPNHFASIVDRVGGAIIAPCQRWKLSHHAVLP
jgi:hypothetical protein